MEKETYYKMRGRLLKCTTTTSALQDGEMVSE
jgi:hypothetical protein